MVSGTINGDPITSGNAAVEFTPGAASAAKTIISAASYVSVDDSPTTVTVQAKDQYGNNTTSSADAVTLSADNGIGALTVAPGSPAPALTRPIWVTTRPGTDTVSGTINGDQITGGNAVGRVRPGAASAARPSSALPASDSDRRRPPDDRHRCRPRISTATT